MSDQYHRPTLTFPSGAYNASQVRLYGISLKEKMGIVYPGKNRNVGNQTMFSDVDLDVGIRPMEGRDDEIYTAKAGEALTKLGHTEGENDAEVFRKIVKGQSSLEPDFPMVFFSQVSIETKRLGAVALTASISVQQAIKSDKIISCGIIVGYAYEGHTYDLPRPKIMIIPTLPEAKMPKDDSGYDVKESEDYAVWIVDKLDECVEFEMNQGFVEQLVLDANMPGKRAPNMYAGRMQLAHRSGRLSE
jgi:hypothetical protein